MSLNCEKVQFPIPKGSTIPPLGSARKWSSPFFTNGDELSASELARM